MVGNNRIGKFAVTLIKAFLLCVFVLEVKAVADEIPAGVNPSRNYHQTLEGMPLPSRTPDNGIMKGYIQTSDSTPLAGGDVFFFNAASGPSPAPEKYWRVPDEIAKLDDKGGFSSELPAGSYYIGAIQRKVDKTMTGPPSEGDIYYAGNNKYEVLPASEKNLEIIRGAKPFSTKIISKKEGITAIAGSVFDASGKPFENGIVFAYKQPTMNDKPLFVSERTGRDGVFLLRVSGAGSYYLRVRDVYGGGAPEEGAFMGAYGGNNPTAITVKTGEVFKGIKLFGDKFVRPKPGSISNSLLK